MTCNCKDLNLAERLKNLELGQRSNLNRIETIEAGEAFDYDERITDIENINAEKRLINLEEIIIVNELQGKNSLSTEAFGVLLKRIEKLESENLMRQDTIEVNVKNLHDRIDQLENGAIRRIGILGNALSNISNGAYKDNKTPYKCPVCHGNCMRPNPLKGCENAMMPVNLDCIVCEGKGIVWG